MLLRRNSLGLVGLTLLLGMVLIPSARAAEPTVEFNRDIRPILSDVCFQCHGPDAAQRQAELRLDLEDQAKSRRESHAIIEPGQVEKSELIRRIRSTDPAERMPPAEAGRQLTAAQIDLLTRWVAEGASWQKHWSLIPPRAADAPKVNTAGWAKNAIDPFVLSRLEAEGLAPSPKADRETLIRRVTLDLTGLPPTLDEVAAFRADTSPDAYERLVDRLLASPRYGERMATRWLDAARYADTNGYQSDGERHMWRWRDWVIDAFNSNMPFDQFTIEQLAGDLLPNPTLEQRIATGFNRNHRGNAEGGIVPEEYAVEYVVDRVDTTATVWMGLTLGCCRCHDHKFDPVTQKQYYQLFAFFNNVPERGKAIKFGNSAPVMAAPTTAQQAELARLAAEEQNAAQQLAQDEPAIRAAQQAWEALPVAQHPAWEPTEFLVAAYPFDDSLAAVTAKQTADSKTEKAQVEAATHPIEYTEGKKGRGAHFDGKTVVTAGDRADFTYLDKFSISLWVRPETLGGTLVSRMTDKPEGDGWAIQLREGHVQVNLIKRWLDDAIRVETEQPIEPDRWTHIAITYDGSRVAAGIKVYLNSVAAPLTVNLDDLNQDFTTKEPLRIGGGGGPAQTFRGTLDEVRIYSAAFDASRIVWESVTESPDELCRIPAAQRTPAQEARLRVVFLDTAAPPRMANLYQVQTRLARERAAFEESIPTVMVMVERPEPRPTFVLNRGEYDKPGEPVERRVLESLAPLPPGAPLNRLGFAQWLVSKEHPLTARVTVNRFWQMFFGAGIVRSVEDLGSQGDWPSHPELLDTLSAGYIDSGWDTKALVKLFVTSATYRQSSRVTPESLARDPENRLLSRAPRLRLPAETIRDQALFVSGLLTEKLGGPSVWPYQPEGLWGDLATLTDYPQSHGPDLYRRSLYSYFKRTVAPPRMMTFDAAGRESCVVRETRTNTPLQALILMNDVTYVEAARVFAERLLLRDNITDSERLDLAFETILSRKPSQREREVLARNLESQRDYYQQHAQEARHWLTAGEAPTQEGLSPAEVAAWGALCNLLLNLDEAVTRQ